MRIVSLVVLLVACGGSSTNGSSGNPGSGSGNSTVIQWTLAAQTTPVVTTITAGTPVAWHNGDNTTHTVVPDNASPPTNVTLAPGATSASQTFSAPGTYTYHCSIHPGMHGSLTVQ